MKKNLRFTYFLIFISRLGIPLKKKLGSAFGQNTQLTADLTI